MIYRLQDLYIHLLSPWIPFVGKLSEKIKYQLITLCFIADLVLFCIVRYVLHKESYFYNTACGICLMICIMILSLDRSLIRIHWRRSMWIAWFGMCIAFTVSDIMVPKKVCGLGIILAFVFTGVFFVWQNHTRKDLLWKCFKDAVKISFWLMAAVSFLFRPLYEGARYAGIFTNPNTFALYLYIIFAVYMSDLDWMVETGKNWKRSLVTYVSLGLVVFYLLLSQARTSMVAIFVIFILWIALRIYLCRKQHAWRNFLQKLTLMIVFCALCFPVYRVALQTVPWIVGHPILFEGESLYLADGDKIEDLGEAVVAEPQADDEVEVAGRPPHMENGEEEEVPQNAVERFWYVLEHTSGLNELTTGRIDIYKGYSARLNYAGHKNIALVINGKKKNHAHNNWLQFGYTYGIFGMFFYALITVMSVAYSLKFYLKERRKNATYAFLIPAVCFGFVVATLTECLFLPFEVFPAFAYWFAFLDLFVKKVPKNKFLQELEEREDVQS